MTNFGVEVRIDGVNRVRNELRRFVSDFPKETREVLHSWGQELRAYLKSSYPPQAHLPLGGFKSEAQRRKVFALIGEGKIPYTRRGRLASSWSAKVTGTSAMIRNSMAEAKWVVGDDTQAHHMRNWWKTSDKIKERLPSLRHQLEQCYNRMAARI